MTTPCPACGAPSWNAAINPGDLCLPCKPKPPTPTPDSLADLRAAVGGDARHGSEGVVNLHRDDYDEACMCGAGGGEGCYCCTDDCPEDCMADHKGEQ